MNVSNSSGDSPFDSIVTNPLIDTHAHLDERVFDADRDTVIRAARAVGVVGIVNIGYRPERWATTFDLTRRYPHVSCAIGLHPAYADDLTAETVPSIASMVDASGVVAIGEIGLDFSRDYPAVDRQVAAFEAQLTLASHVSVPVIIHQRRAQTEVIETLARFSTIQTVILHCFDGSSEMAQFGIARGYYFGVGGLATRQSSVELRAVLASIPADHILLETDAPYLVPSGINDRRNSPINLPRICQRLADLWSLSPDAFAAVTTTNAHRALHLREMATAGAWNEGSRVR